LDNSMLDNSKCVDSLNTSQDSSNSSLRIKGDTLERTIKTNSTLNHSRAQNSASNPSLNNLKFDSLNTSQDSSQGSSQGMLSYSVTPRTPVQRANSTLEISRTRHPSSNTSLEISRGLDRCMPSQNEVVQNFRTLGQRANSTLEMSRARQSGLNPNFNEISIQSLSRSTTEVSKNDTSIEDGATAMPNNQLSDSNHDDWAISEIVESLEIFSVELSNLAQVNDKLQFAEESVDRLEVALLSQQQQQQQQQLRRSGSIPNLTLNTDSAKDHLLCARTEVERLRVINEKVGREIAENQKHLHNLDAAVKAKRSGIHTISIVN